MVMEELKDKIIKLVKQSEDEDYLVAVFTFAEYYPDRTKGRVA